MQLELGQVIDLLPGLAWIALPDGRAELVSRRWCQYTGLSTEQAIGFGWRSAIHPDDRARTLEHWSFIVESAQPGAVAARLRRADGVFDQFLLSLAPIADQSGREVRWCVAAQLVQSTAEELRRAN